ncbi:MAG: 3'-5' exonuclease [Bacteroides sp.]|nr:3'-5' exonuclease [Bacteroides sp.]MCM1414193.1 3'-5' exonuclease [Bacteroides sp.]MCM1472015.1 3'-5' exonuclease [Bacteroides sp.]
MQNFVAIDVETANSSPTSICSVGAVKVTEGIISDTFYTLVHPTPNYYFERFTKEIHGIDRSMTDDQPTFDQILPDLKTFIGRLPLVAHNAQFDRGCLRATAAHYGCIWPDNEFLCSLTAARRSIPRQMVGSYSLPYLANFLGIPFDNHHNALADAEACAKIAITLL